MPNLIPVFQAMESEVNVHYKELWGPKPGYQLLTNQLQRLCMVLDVYLETEPHDPSVEGPKEFPQEKMCLRLVRWELAGTLVALLFPGASLEVCPVGICPHSWAVSQELGLLCGCCGMFLIPVGHSLSLSSSRGPLRLKPFKFNYPQGFFSHR